MFHTGALQHVRRRQLPEATFLYVQLCNSIMAVSFIAIRSLATVMHSLSCEWMTVAPRDRTTWGTIVESRLGLPNTSSSQIFAGSGIGDERQMTKIGLDRRINGKK
jgi:hypothetical protein